MQSATFFSRRHPSNEVIDASTIRKTEGHEAGILHYFVDDAEIREFLVNFNIIKLRHINELVSEKHKSWHYFVLAKKEEQKIKSANL